MANNKFTRIKRRYAKKLQHWWNRLKMNEWFQAAVCLVIAFLCLVFVINPVAFAFWTLFFPRSMADTYNECEFAQDLNSWMLRYLPWYCQKEFMSYGSDNFTAKQQVKYYRRVNPEYVGFMTEEARCYLWNTGNEDDRFLLISNGKYQPSNKQFREILPCYNYYPMIREYLKNCTLKETKLHDIIEQLKELSTIENNANFLELAEMFLDYARNHELSQKLQDYAKTIQNNEFNSEFETAVKIYAQRQTVRSLAKNSEVFFPWCRQNTVYPEVQKQFNLMQYKGFIASGQKLSCIALKEYVRLAGNEEYDQILTSFFGSEDLNDEMRAIVQTSSKAMQIWAGVLASKSSN